GAQVRGVIPVRPGTSLALARAALFEEAVDERLNQPVVERAAVHGRDLFPDAGDSRTRVRDERACERDLAVLKGVEGVRRPLLADLLDHAVVLARDRLARGVRGLPENTPPGDAGLQVLVRDLTGLAGPRVALFPVARDDRHYSPPLWF